MLDDAHATMTGLDDFLFACQPGFRPFSTARQTGLIELSTSYRRGRRDKHQYFNYYIIHTCEGAFSRRFTYAFFLDFSSMIANAIFLGHL